MNTSPRFSRFVLGTSFVLLGFLVFALGISFFLNYQGRNQPRSRDEGIKLAPPTGDLSFESGHDVSALRAEKEDKLHRLEWIDASQGFVHIPIEDAMRITALKYQKKVEVKP